MIDVAEIMRQDPYRDTLSKTRNNNLYTIGEKIAAIKRWGSYDMAAERLGVTYELLREDVPASKYPDIFRKIPVITAEFNHYVTKAW